MRKKEADPASARWNSNGMPMVQVSLAALYDFKNRPPTAATP